MVLLCRDITFDLVYNWSDCECLQDCRIALILDYLLEAMMWLSAPSAEDWLLLVLGLQRHYIHSPRAFKTHCLQNLLCAFINVAPCSM